MKKIFGLRYLEKSEGRKANGGLWLRPGPTPVPGPTRCNSLTGKTVGTYSSGKVSPCETSCGYYMGEDYVKCDGSTYDLAGRLADHV